MKERSRIVSFFLIFFHSFFFFFLSFFQRKRESLLNRSINQRRPHLRENSGRRVLLKTHVARQFLVSAGNYPVTRARNNKRSGVSRRNLLQSSLLALPSPPNTNPSPPPSPWGGSNSGGREKRKAMEAMEAGEPPGLGVDCGWGTGLACLLGMLPKYKAPSSKILTRSSPSPLPAAPYSIAVMFPEKQTQPRSPTNTSISLAVPPRPVAVLIICIKGLSRTHEKCTDSFQHKGGQFLSHKGRIGALAVT